MGKGDGDVGREWWVRGVAWTGGSIMDFDRGGNRMRT